MILPTAQLLTGSTAIITGSNTNATLEPGEPKIAGKSRRAFGLDFVDRRRSTDWSR
jgi:hypothetical protein